MRRAFYALEPGGARDYVTLLHLPYTAWHLSYVVLGACLVPVELVAPARADGARVPRSQWASPRTRSTS